MAAICPCRYPCRMGLVLLMWKLSGSSVSWMYFRVSSSAFPPSSPVASGLPVRTDGNYRSAICRHGSPAGSHKYADRIFAVFACWRKPVAEGDGRLLRLLGRSISLFAGGFRHEFVDRYKISSPIPFNYLPVWKSFATFAHHKRHTKQNIKSKEKT